MTFLQSFELAKLIEQQEDNILELKVELNTDYEGVYHHLEFAIADSKITSNLNEFSKLPIDFVLPACTDWTVEFKRIYKYLESSSYGK